MAKKNLLQSNDVYSRYYGDFRGVDFSSDHTRVTNNRFSYLVNMYRDYRSAQGHAIETIPGYRQLLDKTNGKIYGIHLYPFEGQKFLVIHRNTSLYFTTLASDKEDKIEDVTMAKNKSVSFLHDNKLYILDGTYYIRITFEKNIGEIKAKSEFIKDIAYVPTCYINTIISGDNQNAGTPYEPLNLMSDKFKQTYIGDGASKTDTTENGNLYISNAYVPTYPVKDVVKVKVNDKAISKYTEENTPQFYFKFEDEKVVFYSSGSNTEIPGPADIVEITFSKSDTTQSIRWCTNVVSYDNRFFFFGAPRNPGRVFYSALNDPTYFSEINSFTDGNGTAQVCAMLPVSNTLAVFTDDSSGNSAVYYHTPQTLDDDMVSVIYPQTSGAHGVGCLGPCINFLDDPIFISSRGVEAIERLSLSNERAIAHRSFLIDSKLYSMYPSAIKCRDALKNASLAVWEGYLLMLVEGRIFMADSRQAYSHENGNMQYEWYYLEDIGVYTQNDNGESIGGAFSPATLLKVIDDNIYFATEAGHLCCFNFDKRNKYGEIPYDAYSFDGRTINCGCATKMDNCNIPHLTKSTVNKSTVIKTKLLTTRSAAKVKVRTNKDPFKQLARINSGRFSFDDVDFSDFYFSDAEANESIFAIKEKEKRWVEKQYYIYSDEFQKPFALYYVAYQYTVAGKIKN